MSRECPKCGGEGWIEVSGDGGVQLAQRCVCVTDRLLYQRQRRLRAVVPPLFHDVALDRNPLVALPEPQLERLKRYHDKVSQNINAGKGLWIDGESGVGKSAAAALLVLQATKVGRKALFCDVPELLNTFRASYQEDAALPYAQIHQALHSTDLLVLDDLAAARANDYVKEQLFIVVNDRYKAEKAVVITTDASPDELSEAFGRRLVRRLEDLCGTRRLTLSTDPPTVTPGSEWQPRPVPGATTRARIARAVKEDRSDASLLFDPASPEPSRSVDTAEEAP